MHYRRRSSLMLTAAACCSCRVAESASVRGVASNANANRPKQRHDRPHNDQQQHAEQHQTTQHRTLNSFSHWWHSNKSDEKDIATQPLGPYSSNVNSDKLQAMHATNSESSKPQNALDEGSVAFVSGNGMEPNSAGGDEDGDDGDRGSFSVYSIAVNNEPDTSQLAYRQPTQTPTPRPTRVPTRNPTPLPTKTPMTPSPVKIAEKSDSINNDNDNEMMYYYPLWQTNFKGCTSSFDPPSAYVTTQTYDGNGAKYLFDTKAECCLGWFQSLGTNCVTKEFDMESYADSFNGGDDDDMAAMNGRRSTGSSGSDSRDSPPNNPPTPPTPSNDPNPPSPPTPTFSNIVVGDSTIPNNPPTPPTPSVSSTVVVESTPPPTPPPTTSMPTTKPPTRPPTEPPVAPVDTYVPTPFDTPAPSPVVTEEPRPDVFTVTPVDADSPKPTTFFPSLSPIDPPAFELFNRGTPSPVAVIALSDTLDTSTANHGWDVNALAAPPGEATALIYSTFFEMGVIPYASMDEAYFAWSVAGNGVWGVTQIDEEDMFTKGSNKNVATIGGYGRYAMQSTLKLSIGCIDNHDMDSLLAQGDVYISFGIQTSVEFPMDSAVFRLDGTILGYWTGPNDGWELITAYLPPRRNDQVQELTWEYSYFGSDDADTDREGVIQLDNVVIERTSGEVIISDFDLQGLASSLIELPSLNLHHSLGDAGWEVEKDNTNSYDEGGSYLLSANTRKIIREVNDGHDTVTTYHGMATMTMTIITGPFGGLLHFAIFSQVNAPVDVLEIALDGSPILAATSVSSSWEVHTLDIPQGKHVVTFNHISNPANLPMFTLEGMGQPGSSKVDGLHYVDNIDPALITPDPTTDPTSGPTVSPTVYTIPIQNYCGARLSTIQDTCYTDNPPMTCNGPLDECPNGELCWGNIKCEIPMEEKLALLVESPAPTPDVVSSQNYCGTDLLSIRNNCALGGLTTCNEDDGPCPAGTFCWGNIECDVPKLTPAPTPAPTDNAVMMTTQNYCGHSLASIKNTCSLGGLTTCNDDDGPCPAGTFCWGNIECEAPRVNAVALADLVMSTQNYCGTSLASIKETCSNGNLPTCNEDDDPCSIGTFCWGNVECEVPRANGVSVSSTPAPSLAPKPLDNYCGTSLPSIKATCASGTLTTCNSDDGPCPAGTYCWGTVECDVKTVMNPPTRSPTAKPISLLGSFFSGNSNSGNKAPAASSCPEGFSSAQGFPDCCVLDSSFLGDGACDAYAPYNTAECGWDGGDCCQESCETDTPFGCAAKEGDSFGPFGFYCLDPTFSVIDEDDCDAENREWVGDGGCDPDFNTAECGWDGGDCCRETCDSQFAYFECGREAQPFDCKNPDIIYRMDYVP